MRGRKPVPAAVAEARGNPRQRGKKIRAAQLKREAVVTGDLHTGAGPDHLTPEEREDWDHAIASAPPGLLKRLDRGILTVWVTACNLHRQAKLEQAKVTMILRSAAGLPYQSPYLGIINRQAEIMMRAASELGFTPASRPRIFSVPAPGGEGLTSAPDEELHAAKAAGRAKGNVVDFDAYLASDPSKTPARR